MVTEKTIEFRVRVKVDEEKVTDSPYWPLAAQGRPAEAAEHQLVAAEITAALERLPYITDVKVTESFN
jgi:hypothetical protein